MAVWGKTLAEEMSICSRVGVIYRRVYSDDSVKLSSLYKAKISRLSSAGKIPAQFFDLATTCRRYRLKIVAVSREIMSTACRGKICRLNFGISNDMLSLYVVYCGDISNDTSSLFPLPFVLSLFLNNLDFIICY